MNNITVIGGLGRDPETKQTTNGVRYAIFSIADNGFANGQKLTMWWNCSTYDERAIDFLTKYCKKGSSVVVSGEVSERTFTGRDGTQKTDRAISVYKVGFAGTRSDNNGGQANATPTTAPTTAPVVAPATTLNVTVEDDTGLPF